MWHRQGAGGSGGVARPSVWPPHFELDRTNVLGFVTLLAASDIELDTLTLLEGPKAASLNGGEVDEHIIALFTRDKAVALLLVEELHSACSQRVHILQFNRRGPNGPARRFQCTA